MVGILSGSEGLVGATVSLFLALYSPSTRLVGHKWVPNLSFFINLASTVCLTLVFPDILPHLTHLP